MWLMWYNSFGRNWGKHELFVRHEGNVKSQNVEKIRTKIQNRFFDVCKINQSTWKTGRGKNDINPYLLPEESVFRTKLVSAELHFGNAEVSVNGRGKKTCPNKDNINYVLQYQSYN